MKRGAKLTAAALCLFCLCFFAFPRIAGSYCYVSLIYKINEDKLERAVLSLRAGCAATPPELRGVRGVSFESADGTVGFACFSFGIAPAPAFPSASPRRDFTRASTIRPTARRKPFRRRKSSSAPTANHGGTTNPAATTAMSLAELREIGTITGWASEIYEKAPSVWRALRLCGVIFRAFC